MNAHHVAQFDMITCLCVTDSFVFTDREQKLMEAEERRKKDEELRLKKLRANEAEQKRVAEALARKKEYEEADRQRKV